MTWYEEHVLPWLIHLAMRAKAATAERARLVPLASGVTLEVGVGSGLNLPFYRGRVDRLYALDPSRSLLRMARSRGPAAAAPIEWIEGSAEAIPLEDRLADTVVTTWTLCTIGHPVQALREMRRVLKPDGRLLFIEHGQAPTAGVRAWQERLTPVWQRIAGGCRLTRPIDTLVRTAGFTIERIETGYGAGPRPFAYLYRGVARPTVAGTHEGVLLGPRSDDPGGEASPNERRSG